MKPFSVLFDEAKSNVIDYNGRTVFSVLRCTKPDKYMIRIRNSSVNSNEEQMIRISTNFVGSLTINGDKIKKKKGVFSGISIPEDEIGEEMVIVLELKEGRFIIYNESFPEDSEFSRSMVFGCAMNPVKLDDGWFRIYCNEHTIDDDFDDLIFDMKVETENGTVDIIEEWQPIYTLRPD